MHVRYYVLCILIFIALVLTGNAVENKPGLTLKETFTIYVQSIQNSDLKGLFSTVSDSKEFFFLTSAGKLINTREAYYKFHEDWFREQAWEMPVELLEVHEGQDYGYTTAIYHYKSKMPEKATYYIDAYFTLIFHKENERWKVVADVTTPIDRAISEGDSELKYSTDQVLILNLIMDYRTVYKYKSTPVPKEHIMKILEAARMAPTVGNQQPWKFLVIQDKNKITQLKDEAFKWYFAEFEGKEITDPEKLKTAKETIKKVLEDALSAPVYVAVLVDTKVKQPEYILYDGTFAAAYLMIAAKALGYGTAFFTSFFPETQMKDFFKIPDNYKLICFTPIGIPDGKVLSPRKKALKDFVVFEAF